MPQRGIGEILHAARHAAARRCFIDNSATAIPSGDPNNTAITLRENSCSPYRDLRLPLLRSERRRGAGRGGALHRWTARNGEAPLSPSLAPFVPHGARETDALLSPTVPARTIATIDSCAISRRFLRCPAGATTNRGPSPGAAPATAGLPPANLLRRPAGTGTMSPSIPARKIVGPEFFPHRAAPATAHSATPRRRRLNRIPRSETNPIRNGGARRRGSPPAPTP